jgi:hypothetical protein
LLSQRSKSTTIFMGNHRAPDRPVATASQG